MKAKGQCSNSQWTKIWKKCNLVKPYCFLQRLNSTLFLKFFRMERLQNILAFIYCTIFSFFSPLVYAVFQFSRPVFERTLYVLGFFSGKKICNEILVHACSIWVASCCLRDCLVPCICPKKMKQKFQCLGQSFPLPWFLHFFDLFTCTLYSKSSNSDSVQFLSKKFIALF